MLALLVSGVLVLPTGGVDGARCSARSLTAFAPASRLASTSSSAQLSSPVARSTTVSWGRQHSSGRFRLTLDMTLDEGGEDGNAGDLSGSGFELKNPFDPVKVEEQQSDAESLRDIIRRRAEGELDMEESELTQAAIREATRRKLSGESDSPSPWEYLGIQDDVDPNDRFKVWKKVDYTDIFHNINSMMTEEERASIKRVDPLWGRPWWEQIYYYARQTEWGDPKDALKSVPIVIFIGAFLWWYSDFTSTWVTKFMEDWGLMPRYADAVKDLDWESMGIPKEMFGPSEVDLERSKQVANVVVKLLDTAADGKLSETAKASILGTDVPEAASTAADAASAASSAAADAVSSVLDNIPDLGN